MSERRHPHVINVDEADMRPMSKGSKFGSEIRLLGHGAGAHGLGCNHFTVQPGRSAFPRHFHSAIEEALFILEGTGTLALGEERVEVRAGDWVTMPVGPEHAHRLDNTSEAPLRYLCISTHARVDVVGYPDSKKLGVFASGSDDFLAPKWVRTFVREGESLDYYDGEDVE